MVDYSDRDQGVTLEGLFTCPECNYDCVDWCGDKLGPCPSCGAEFEWGATPIEDLFEQAQHELWRRRMAHHVRLRDSYPLCLIDGGLERAETTGAIAALIDRRCGHGERPLTDLEIIHG